MSARPALATAGAVLLAAFLAFFVPYPLCSSDWPQYRGANHDGISSDRIQKQWGETGPKEIWRVPCTNGLSSFAVANGLAVTQIRRDSGAGDREVCVCLDARTGREIWASVIGGTGYDSGVGLDDGPRSTPTIRGERVYVLSSFLVMHCLDASTGAPVWKKDLCALYGGSVIGWQSAASPVIEDDLIFVNCNSASQSLLALRAADGSLAWRSQTERMTQSSPVSAVIEGMPQIIFATQTGLVSLNRTNGTRLWKAPYPFAYTTSLAASPLVSSNIVFLSANYSMGSFASRVSRSGDTWTTTPIWTNSAYKAHWMSSVSSGGYIYGLFGSSTTASLMCIDLLKGTQRWARSGFGRGGILLVGNTLMTLTERGDLVLIDPDSGAYAERARWTLFPNYDPDGNKCWNVPAVCDGVVYARSTAEAVCLDLSIPSLKLVAAEFTGVEARFRITTTTGVPIDSSRFANLLVRSSTDPSLPLEQWGGISNSLQLVDGVVEVSVPCAESQRFFTVTESP
jgi:outer membrane protein assembly factor BamB